MMSHVLRKDAREVADTITIAGKPVKKATLGIGIAGAAVLGIGVYRYRKQQAAAAAAQAATDATTAAGTGAGASDQLDPATGFPYGSVEDASALTAQAGYNYPVSAGSGGGFPGGGGGGGTIATGFTSNPQWAQAAEDYLVQNTGANPQVVGNALGKYIVGSPVADADHSVINQAIAFEGIPPVPGADGFPPGIRTAPAQGTPPPVTRAPAQAPPGLSQTPHGTTVNYGWGVVPGATGYDFEQDGKTLSETGNHVAGLTVTKGSHKWRVRARNSAGTGPWSGLRSFTMR
jgi:hypothetical protein